MKFVLKYKVISIMPKVTALDIAIDVLNTNYEGWRVDAPLPPDILCLCLSYLIEEKETYKDDGSPDNHGFYFDKKKYGEWKEWWDDGQLSEIAYYVNDKMHGECNYYDFTRRECVTYTNGVMNGIRRIWYNDRLESEAVYVKGNNHGVYKEYYTNGRIKTHVKYVKGKKHGDERHWNIYGTLLSKESFKRGHSHRLIKWTTVRGFIVRVRIK